MAGKTNADGYSGLPRGGQPGNQSKVNHKRWTQAIDRALAKRSKSSGIEALDALAEKLLTLCDGGDISALRELGDRLEGKPVQVIAGDPDNPFNVSLDAAKSELLSRLGARAAAGGSQGVGGDPE